MWTFKNLGLKIIIIKMSVLAGAKGPLFQDLQTTLFCNFHLISSDISKYMLGKVTFSAGFTGKTKGGKVLLRAAIAGEGNIKREQFCKDYDNL